jgi:hypothetical protein
MRILSLEGVPANPNGRVTKRSQPQAHVFDALNGADARTMASEPVAKPALQAR